MIEGLIWLPAKLLGWVGDWILKQFGVSIDGGLGNKIIEIFRSSFGQLFEFYAKPFRVLASFFESDAETETESFLSRLMDRIKQFPELLSKWIENLPGIKFIKDGLGWLGEKFGNAKEAVSNLFNFDKVKKTTVDTLDKIDNLRKKSIEESKKMEKNYKEKMLQTQKDMAEMQKKLNTIAKETKESTDKNMTQLNQTIVTHSNNVNNSSDSIPDEIGSVSIMFKNKNWGMS